MGGWCGARGEGGGRARVPGGAWPLRAARLGLLALALAIGTAACGGAASPTAPPATATVAGATPTASAPVAPSAMPSPVATASRPATGTRAATPAATSTRGAVNNPEVALLAVEALSREIGVPQEQILVAEVEEREWPSSALGCPEPGRAYLQVVTPGYRIVLVAQGKNYEYHTNQKSMVVRCAP